MAQNTNTNTQNMNTQNTQNKEATMNNTQNTQNMNTLSEKAAEALTTFLTAEAVTEAMGSGAAILAGLRLPAEKCEAAPLIIKAEALRAALNNRREKAEAARKAALEAVKKAEAVIAKAEAEAEEFNRRGVTISEERAAYLDIIKDEAEEKREKAEERYEKAVKVKAAMVNALALAPIAYLPAEGLQAEDLRKADLLRAGVFGEALPYDTALITALIKAVRELRAYKEEAGRKELKKAREKALCDLLAYYGGSKSAKVNATEADFICTWLLPSIEIKFLKTSKKSEEAAYIVGMQDTMEGRAFASRLARIAIMKLEGVKVTPENVTVKSKK